MNYHTLQKLFRAISVLCLFCASVLAPLLASKTALAHTRVEVGPYVIIVGWLEEPVIVNERNALVIEVTEDDRPVTGLEGTLNATIIYAGRTYSGNLTPTEEEGLYTVEILPTRRGQFSVQLTGSIEEMEIDETVDPEEVLTARVLQFPEVPPEAVELQAQINTLSGQVSTARLLAIGGLAVGVLGLVVGALGLRRK